MLSALRVRAYAKVNLSLAVLGKRPDGYHDLAGVMARTRLWEEVCLRPAGDVRVRFDVTVPEDNTVLRMARGYFALAGKGGAERGAALADFALAGGSGAGEMEGKDRRGAQFALAGRGGAEIVVKKRIPSEAGLGGASADAAAVLHGLEYFYGPLELATREKLCLSVGADVPFCYHGGIAFVEGVGERITPLPDLPLPLLVVDGERGISTRELFAGVAPPYEQLDHGALRRAVETRDIVAIGKNMHNGLEKHAVLMAPDIAARKQALLNLGALGACMTGSGSAVIGLFYSDEEALSAGRRLDKNWVWHLA